MRTFSASILVKENLPGSVVGATIVAVESVVVLVPFVTVFAPSVVVFVPSPKFENLVLDRARMND